MRVDTQLTCQFAFEVPFANLDYASMFGDYIFALAHLIDTNPVYANWVTNRAEGMELYLDNGAYELGHSMDIDHYVHIIEALQPTVAVVPDVMSDLPKTLNLTKQFFDKKLPTGTQYMVVPQGKTTDEWIICLHKMTRMFRHKFQIIGIPRVMYPRRLQLARHAHSFTTKPIHILGCVETSEIAGMLSSYVPIRSLDTSWVARHALGKTGHKDKLDFETDNLDFNTFQNSVNTFLNQIAPSLPPRIDGVEAIEQDIDPALKRAREREELEDERDQFAPPKKPIKAPLPFIDEADWKEEEEEDD
jgi:hypothetical protein